MDQSIWDTPIHICRDGKTSVIPVRELKVGDEVWRYDGVSGKVKDMVSDEEEGVLYIGTNGIDLYPVQQYVGEL